MFIIYFDSNRYLHAKYVICLPMSDIIKSDLVQLSEFDVDFTEISKHSIGDNVK